MIVRAATLADVPELCGLLNEIIAIGGTTARQVQFDEEQFAQWHLERDSFVSCLVAEGDGLLGYQTLNRSDKLPADCADIASFARATNKVKGVGRALFEQSILVAKAAGFLQINATIRADNVPGLGYYSAMGFVDFSVAKAVPLADGTPVDRISKRYHLN